MRASRLVSGPKHVQTFQIQEVHPGPHSYACNFCHFYFSYLSYLRHTSLLGLQMKTRGYSNASTFFSFQTRNLETSMSSAVNFFVHAVRKHSKKCLVQKVDNFSSLGPIPIIQSPFNSTCVALQYEPGNNFFHQVVPELHGHKNQKFQYNHVVFLYVLKK